MGFRDPAWRPPESLVSILGERMSLDKSAKLDRIYYKTWGFLFGVNPMTASQNLEGRNR